MTKSRKVEKSPTLSLVMLVTGVMEPDSESRIREVRSSGLMRGSVQPASCHFAYSSPKCCL